MQIGEKLKLLKEKVLLGNIRILLQDDARNMPKRNRNENVINQGLFYLDWLLDHKAEFKLLVMDRLEADVANVIDWSAPRLICIANDFNKYDEHAVEQINRNIELIRYRRYGEEFLLLELVNATTAAVNITESCKPEKTSKKTKKGDRYKTAEESLAEAPVEVLSLWNGLKDFCLGLGDDVQLRTLKYYFAFKTMRNFCSVEFRNKDKFLKLWVTADVGSLDLQRYPEGFCRDVTGIGHWGTGDLEICVKDNRDLKLAMEIIEEIYAG